VPSFSFGGGVVVFFYIYIYIYSDEYPSGICHQIGHDCSLLNPRLLHSFELRSDTGM
jgi:hypothetical protein